MLLGRLLIRYIKQTVRLACMVSYLDKQNGTLKKAKDLITTKTSNSFAA
jgi:hypothetical protein